MPVTQDHIDVATPMGATLVNGGATFRAWAPAARAVYVVTDDLAAAHAGNGYRPRPTDALLPHEDGTWTGFVAGVTDGDPYLFWVEGDDGHPGLKRDPHARELGCLPVFPECDCLVRSAQSYPWHDEGFRSPDFADLVIYQLHIGTYYGRDGKGVDTRRTRRARFLDLLYRIDYLRELGVNAVQPLPIQEYPSRFSMGYNGTDLFSPESDYQLEEDGEIRPYLEEVNRQLRALGQPPLAIEDIRSGPNQLKCVIDLCHLNGMAFLLDVVYNHAGGGFDPQSLYFFDKRVFTSNDDSLYFTSSGWAGGLIFAYHDPNVRQFLIDNAAFFLREYHADGFRYDEVSVIDNFGGWRFAQDLTSTIRFLEPRAIQIAEYWNDYRWLAVEPPPDGMGFDAAWADGLRIAVRAAVRQASFGADAPLDLAGIAQNLYPPRRFSAAWRAVQCLENHDIVYADRPSDRLQLRVPALADPSDPTSWWARSRTRVATGLLLTAPGIPMLFMGEEFLESSDWSDNPDFDPAGLIDWDALDRTPARRDFLAFTRDLARLRRELPALRSEGISVFHVNDGGRVLAFQRWIPGVGEDVVVVASFSEGAYPRYDLGFPRGGVWREVFNSDFYDRMPNPDTVGNGGQVRADGAPLHGLPRSASIVIPPCGFLVFAPEA